jgi:hypothetical protein
MTTQYLIFGIEAAPGDKPRALEQINGDLLLPAAGRPILERALREAEDALPPERRAELEALADARELLGIVKVDTERETLLANLTKVRPL